MNTYRPFIILSASIVLFVLYSCSSNINRELTSAELLMDSNPDSALCILNEVDTTRLKVGSQYARFALLKTMALDKTYYDETDSRLIDAAVSYYSMRGTSEQRMKAWYYQGVIRFNSGNLPAATVSLEKAEQEAITLADYHYLGLIYRYIANVFDQSNNLTETVNYARRSMHAFEKNDEGIYVKYAKSALGIALMNNRQYDEARLLFNDLLNGEIDSVLRVNVNSYLADTYVMHCDSIDRAIEIYNSLPKEELSLFACSNYALALAFKGDKQEVKDILDRTYRAVTNYEEKATIDYTVAVIDSINGDYRNAYIKTRTASKVQDSLTRDLLRQSTIAAQRDYYISETQIRDGIVRRQKNIMISGSIIVFLLIAVGLLLSVIWNQKRESSLKEQMARLTMLNKNTQIDNSQLIGALFFERISRLCSISGNYYSTEDNKSKDECLSQFKKGLRDIQDSPVLFDGLESDLNNYCSNIMRLLREEVPNMSERHYRFVGLFMAGVPNELIQIIMACNSVASIRTMRSRIRSEIKAATPKDESLFLDMLEARKQPPKNTQE